MLAHVFQIFGDVAQLGERGVRNAEARGSIPLISTKRQSNSIQRRPKPTKNSGFFVAIRPETCYDVLQNTPIMGIREGVIYTQKLPDTPKKGECNAEANYSIIRHEGSKSKSKG